MLPKIVFIAFCTLARGQLNINVRLKEHDIVQESFTSNLTDNTVTLKLRKLDGTSVVLVQNFADELQIMKVEILGDPYLGEDPTSSQSVCFMFHLPVRLANEVDGEETSELVPPDAMVKLRQKNPGVVRVAEDDKGVVHMVLDSAIDVTKSSIVSHSADELCKDAGKVIYTKDGDVKQSIGQKDEETRQKISESVQKITDMQNYPLCSLVEPSNIQQPCVCLSNQCIPWYPCGLKFCQSIDANGKPTSYRCGIKTCRKCYSFEYLSASKLLCMWN